MCLNLMKSARSSQKLEMGPSGLSKIVKDNEIRYTYSAAKYREVRHISVGKAFILKLQGK